MAEELVDRVRVWSKSGDATMLLNVGFPVPAV